VNVVVKLSDAEDAYIIKNLWPLYQHDHSEFDTGLVLNRHGLFGVDDSIATLARHADSQEAWWKDPESLFPYLIRVDGLPAGFNLVAARRRLPHLIDADFVVHEFFVLHAYRGKGVAERAAIEGFNRHRGKWEVVTSPPNARAIAFWRRVVSRYSPNGHSEKEVDHPWGRKVAWSFDNSGEPSQQPRQRAPSGGIEE
jgi:aminoglycoside 6'-N-acetyltransferase I